MCSWVVLCCICWTSFSGDVLTCFDLCICAQCRSITFGRVCVGSSLSSTSAIDTCPLYCLYHHHFRLSLGKQSIAGAGSSSSVPFLLATESCNCPGVADGTQALFEDVGKGWQRGERLMRDSLSDLNHYSVGYVDWNLLVDYNGGEFLWCGGVYCLWLLVCVVCTGFTTDRENSRKSFSLPNDTTPHYPNTTYINTTRFS